jgi:hypothetical protein
MKKFLLFLGAVLSIFFASVQAQNGLFFSEYAEGSGNNKGVEIYNPTPEAINLSDYYVVRYSNGSSVFTEGGITHLSGTIEPYKTFVLINGQTTSTPTSPACSPEMQLLADQLDGVYPAPTYMNGNDAIALIKTTNGQPPSTSNPGTPMDLIGQIGLGNAITAETGWSYVQDSTLTYNNSSGDPVTGKVINYIVQAKATDGVTYGPFWMSWTSDHSLIRKSNVVHGVFSNPNPFIVKQEWDTVPAKVDTATGFLVYKDIWDNLGSHNCIADPNYAAINELISNGSADIFPNPVISEQFTVTSSKVIKTVQIFDVEGKQVQNEVLSVPQKEAKVVLTSSQPGIYLVKIVFSDNKASVEKILVK